jgi:hypothetical protein
MRKLPFQFVPGAFRATHTAGYLTNDDTVFDALRDAVMEELGTEVELTIGGHTMHFAAWLDPDHWADDWAVELDVDHEDAVSAVAALLEATVVDE